MRNKSTSPSKIPVKTVETICIEEKLHIINQLGKGEQITNI
jgi:hypothetical protein